MVTSSIKSLSRNLTATISRNHRGIYDEGYVFCAIYSYLLNR